MECCDPLSCLSLAVVIVELTIPNKEVFDLLMGGWGGIPQRLLKCCVVFRLLFWWAISIVVAEIKFLPVQHVGSIA